MEEIYLRAGKEVNRLSRWVATARTGAIPDTSSDPKP
jgi:hypothetical protein